MRLGEQTFLRLLSEAKQGEGLSLAGIREDWAFGDGQLAAGSQPQKRALARESLPCDCLRKEKENVWIVGRRFGESQLGEIKASARRQSDFQTRAEHKSEETS